MATREEYVARFTTRAEAVRYEDSVLSIGDEFLPPEAISVREGAEPTPAYWTWLIDQVDQNDADQVSP